MVIYSFPRLTFLTIKLNGPDWNAFDSFLGHAQGITLHKDFLSYVPP